MDLEVPIGQTVQASVSVSAIAPAFANLPAGQIFAVKVKHGPPLPVVYEPAGHVFAVKVRQSASLEDPVVILYLPAAQRVHDDWPVKD